MASPEIPQPVSPVLTYGNDTPPIAQPPSIVIGPYNSTEARWRIQVYGDADTSPEEKRAHRVLSDETSLSATPDVFLPQRTSETDTTMQHDLIDLPHTSEVSIESPSRSAPSRVVDRAAGRPRTGQIYATSQDFIDSMQVSYTLCSTLSKSDVQASNVQPGDTWVEVTCRQHLEGCLFYARAYKGPDGTWHVSSTHLTHEHASITSDKGKARSPTPDLRITRQKRSRTADIVDDDGEEEEIAERGVGKGRGTPVGITHPTTGKETHVRLRNANVFPIVYSQDLADGRLPPIHSVWDTREAFKAALDRHGELSDPPQAYKATSSNRTPGTERIVYSCAQYNKNRHQASCSFMIRAKRMPENGLWIVTTLNPAHSSHIDANSHLTAKRLTHLRGKEGSVEPREQSLEPPSMSLKPPPRTTRRSAGRLREISDDETSNVSADYDEVLPAGTSTRTARPRPLYFQEERELTPGLVGNYNYRSERTPLSDDEHTITLDVPPVTVSRLRAIDDDTFPEATGGESSAVSDIDSDRPTPSRGGWRGGRRGRNRGSSSIASSRLVKVRKFEHVDGVYVSEAQEGHFDRRLPWPSNKRIPPLNESLRLYLSTTNPPSGAAHDSIATVAPDDAESLEAYLARLHPALLEAIGALQKGGVDSVQGLLDLPRERFSQFPNVSPVQKAILLGRIPLRG